VPSFAGDFSRTKGGAGSPGSPNRSMTDGSRATWMQSNSSRARLEIPAKTLFHPSCEHVGLLAPKSTLSQKTSHAHGDCAASCSLTMFRQTETPRKDDPRLDDRENEEEHLRRWGVATKRNAGEIMRPARKRKESDSRTRKLWMTKASAATAPRANHISESGGKRGCSLPEDTPSV